MDMDSPRGVADLPFVRFDESVSKIEWNDSFSVSTWTIETTVLKSAVQVPVGEEEKSKERDDVPLSRLEQIQDRLQELKDKSQEDVHEYQLRLKQAKIDCEEMLQEQYQVRDIKREGPSRSSTKRTVKELLVEDCFKIIHYLREQNAIQRQQMKVLKKGIKEWKVKNQTLQNANRVATEAKEGLDSHGEMLENMYAARTHNIVVYKDHLATMTTELKKRQAYHEIEAKTCRTYDQVICKIVSRAQERHADLLVEQLIEDVMQGHAEASEARSTTLSNAGVISSMSSDAGASSNLMELAFAVFKDKSRSPWSSSSSSSSESDDEDSD
jgi:hypothetical protein